MKIYRHTVLVNEKEEITVNSQRKLTFTGLAKEVQDKHKGVVTSMKLIKVHEDNVSIDKL